jgi:hypothetical protein
LDGELMGVDWCLRLSIHPPLLLASPGILSLHNSFVYIFPNFAHKIIK